LQDVANIEIVRFEGLLIDCLRTCGASVIIRGLRALSDFDYEFQMAFTNRKMMEEAETVFLMPNERFTYLNSTSVKQIARFGGTVSAFVPACVERTMKNKMQ
jgi:pantetheine-phosphate adenylyltransferase